MPLDITTKRVADVSDLPVKNADGSPMIDPDTGNPITAVVFGPATKVWQAADGLRRRKGIKRSREANGKFEAALDHEVPDTIEFLCAITKRFNGIEISGVQGDADTVRAVYTDANLGFVRDHMFEDTRNWENFMKASQSPSISGSDSLPG